LCAEKTLTLSLTLTVTLTPHSNPNPNLIITLAECKEFRAPFMRQDKSDRTLEQWQNIRKFVRQITSCTI